jgi:hypothetical protein
LSSRCTLGSSTDDITFEDRLQKLLELFLVRAEKAGTEVIGVASNLETFPGVGRKGMCQHCAFSACSLTSYPQLLQSNFMNLT